MPPPFRSFFQVLQFLQVPRAQEVGTDYYLCPYPPSSWKHTWHPIKGITECSHQRKAANVQTPKPKINSNLPQNTEWGSCIDVAHQDYSLVSLNSLTEKTISKIKKLRNHSQLKEQENSPANNETDLCSLTDTEF